MSKQFELFNKKTGREKKKTRKHRFEVVIDSWGIDTVQETEKPHECFACQLPINIGSQAEKQTPIVDDRSQWQYARYKHLPKCPPPEDEPR